MVMKAGLFRIVNPSRAVCRLSRSADDGRLRFGDERLRAPIRIGGGRREFTATFAGNGGRVRYFTLFGLFLSQPQSPPHDPPLRFFRLPKTLRTYSTAVIATTASAAQVCQSEFMLKSHQAPDLKYYQRGHGGEQRHEKELTERPFPRVSFAGDHG